MMLLKDVTKLHCAVSRYTSIQSTRVDQRAQLPCHTSHRLVPWSPSVWHGLRWHSIWTWWADREGWSSTTPTCLSRL